MTYGFDRSAAAGALALLPPVGSPKAETVDEPELAVVVRLSSTRPLLVSLVRRELAPRPSAAGDAGGPATAA